jgi:hypothetical protein
MTSYGFRVYGDAKPQGSHIPGVSKSGKAFLREQAGDGLTRWRKQIVLAAFEARGLDEEGNEVPGVTPVPTIGKERPCRVQINFLTSRPASTKRKFPSVQPDLDKMVRAVLDSLQQAGVFVNDGQVVSIQATKAYSTDDSANNAPGAWIVISEIA